MRYKARHMRVDGKGWLWVAGRPICLLVYDGQDWYSFYEHVRGIDPSNTRLTYEDNTRLTYEDREGNIWVGTVRTEGLVFCDLLQSPVIHRRPTGCPIRGSSCLEEDGAGRLWIGTTKGLSLL